MPQRSPIAVAAHRRDSESGLGFRGSALHSAPLTVVSECVLLLCKHCPQPRRVLTTVIMAVTTTAHVITPLLTVVPCTTSEDFPCVTGVAGAV